VGRIVRKQWDDTPSFRRRRSAEIDSTGMTVDDGVSRMLYRWPLFRQARESEHLLILTDETARRHMLPKRAFDPFQLQSARSLIASHVADCKFDVRPAGFDVLPAPPLPPQTVTASGGTA